MSNGRYLRPGQQATGLPPGLDGDFLSLPISGAHFADGDAVPTVSATYAARASGLLVPAEYARTPVPLDSVGTYLTGRDVLGMSIPGEITFDHLRRLPLLDVIGFCAELLKLVDQPGCSRAHVDATLRPAFLPAAQRRIVALLARGNRVLVAPQVLLELIKNAARIGGGCLLPGVQSGSLIVAMLGLGDALQQGSEEDADNDVVIRTGTQGDSNARSSPPITSTARPIPRMYSRNSSAGGSSFQLNSQTTPTLSTSQRSSATPWGSRWTTSSRSAYFCTPPPPADALVCREICCHT